MIRWPSFLVGGAVLALVVLSAAAVGMTLADSVADRRPTITEVVVDETRVTDSVAIIVRWEQVTKAAEMDVTIEAFGLTGATRLPADMVEFGTVLPQPYWVGDYPIRVTVCAYRHAGDVRGDCTTSNGSVSLGSSETIGTIS